MLSLGTSGVCFVASERFLANPEQGVHAFCHCLPARFHQMAVLLSAASCVAWLTRLVGAPSEEALLAEINPASLGASTPTFLPYLSGERTPHNDPYAKGVFFGLTSDTTRADLARAVLEGVAFAFVDGRDALQAAGSAMSEVRVVGGGARSGLWGHILANALERRLIYPKDAEIGPAAGAARLARLAVTGESPEQVCLAPETRMTCDPDPRLAARYRERMPAFRGLYDTLKNTFRIDSEARLR